MPARPPNGDTAPLVGVALLHVAVVALVDRLEHRTVHERKVRSVDVALAPQLPVRLHPMPHPTLRQIHRTRRRHVAQTVQDPLATNTEMIRQRPRRPIQVRVHEPPVALHLLRPIEPQLRLVPRHPIRERNLPQRPIQREVPRVIIARERRRMTLRRPTQRRPAVRATVRQNVHTTLTITRHDHRLRPDPARHPITRLFDLRLMTDEHPATSEDPLHLVRKHLRIRVQTAVHPILQHQILIRHRHEPLPHNPSLITLGNLTSARGEGQKS